MKTFICMIRFFVALWFMTYVESAEEHHYADCADNEAAFPLSTDKWRTCSWAKKWTKGRCAMDLVKKECPVTCGECKTLETTCADYDKSFQVWIQGKQVWRSCRWVRRDRKNRCRRPIPLNMCPDTCGMCSSITDDSPSEEIQNCSDGAEKFLVNNNWETCEWLARKNNQDITQRLCQRDDVLRKCPMTCGHCHYDPNSSIIQNDMQWYDQNNEPLRAARCGSIATPKIDGYYYMVGSEPSKTWEQGGDIWIYRSLNLGSNSWEHVKTIVLEHKTTSSCNINQHKNGNVFIHCRTDIFVSTNGVEGNYMELPSLTNNIGTTDERSRKFGGSSTFVDDGKMYIITSRLNKLTRDRDIFLYRLNDTWTDWHPEERLVATWPGQRRESPDIVKTDNGYYYFASETHGWKDSRTFYRRSNSLVGLSKAIEREVTFLPGNTKTIESLGSQFCSINRLEDNKWIFQGRRHPVEDPSSWDKTYGMFVVAPVKFKNGVPTVYWKREFDVKTFDYDVNNPSYDSHDHGGLGHASLK